ncbi:MAG: hypothetical protein Q4G49_07930, partial [Paracoccus sp. (in: a-proteobacteria)]|nr:hypothetical protein [Paracoccus sp. (in: a-proteobacteria)]
MTRPAAPRFAMSFTQDAVILERHGPEGWVPLGHARFDHGDLHRRLAALRDEARETDGLPDSGGPDTILVIPEDQILYTTLTVPPGSDPAIAVARALDGMTPYPVEDLAFDWAGADNGDDALRVAAVARQTLDEAEDFATAQGFRPSRFIARPEGDRFPGQPDFGASAMAREAETEHAARTAPDLASAGITAPDIALPKDEPLPAPVLMVSRIVPHVVAVTAEADEPAPAPEVAPAQPVESLIAEPVEAESTEKPASHPTVGPATVIRHAPHGAARPLNPRAQALRERAAEARARRVEPAVAAPTRTGLLTRLFPGGSSAPRPIGAASRLPDLTTLPAMLGLLAVGLIVALWLFGGSGSDSPQPQQVAEPQVQEPATETAAAPVEPTPAPAPAPVETAIAPEVIAPAPDDALTAALIEAMDTPAFEDTTEPGVEPDQPADTQIAAAPQAIPPAPLTPAAGNTAAAVDQAFATPLPESEQPPAAATDREPQTAPAGATAPAPASRPARPVTPTPTPETTAAVPAAPPRLSLSRSARPQTPPSRAAAPTADPAPAVPTNPQPFAQRSEPAPARVTGARPAQRPARPAVTRAAAPAPAAQPAAAPAPAPAPTARPAATPTTTAARPPRKPGGQGETREEGSAPEPDGQLTLTADE